MLVDSFVVDSPNVRYDDEHITTVYECAPPRRNPAARPLALRRSARPTVGALACTALPAHPFSQPPSVPSLTPSSFTTAQLCKHFRGAARRRLGGLARHHALRVSHEAQGAQIRVRRCVQSCSHTSLVSHFFFPPQYIRLMLVGWGGNNGTTVTAGILANRRRVLPILPVSSTPHSLIHAEG